MSADLDADPGRRAARRVATLGLSVGGICLLAGVAVYLGAELDMLPAMWTEALRPTAAKDLALAAVAVLGAILVSVGVVFALLERTGVLAAATGSRHGIQAAGPRHDLPEPESRRGAATPTRSDPAQVPAPAPDHRAGPSGTGDAEPGAIRIRGAAPDDRPNSRTSGAPGPGTPGAAPIRDGERSQARAAEPRSEDAAGPEPEVQSAEPRAPATETAAPPLAVEEPPPAEAPQPGDLIAAWDGYRRDGDGHFSRRGLQGVLDRRGLAADIGDGARVGAGGAMLIVETPSSAPNFYVLPSFNKSPRAVADWFDDSSGGALTGRTQRVTRIARGRWVEAGTEIGRRFEVLERGEVA